MRKIYNFIFCIILFFLLFSCYSYKVPNDVIRVIEIEDDNLCMMEGVQFKYIDTRMIYWKCRLRIIDQRISGEFGDYGYSQLHKGEFKRLRKIIKNRIEEQRRIGLSEMEGSIEEKEHNYCVLYKEQQNDNPEYDYLECRKELENARETKENFSNLTNEYMIKIFEYDETTDQSKNTGSIYVDKECIKYVSDKENFKKCQEKATDLHNCFNKIENDILQRNIDDKIYCTKMSLEKYPDSLAKYENQNSQSSMLGPKMNKLDIVNLREKTFKECYNGRLQKVSSYRTSLENECKEKYLKNIE